MCVYPRVDNHKSLGATGEVGKRLPALPPLHEALGSGFFANLTLI